MKQKQTIIVVVLTLIPVVVLAGIVIRNVLTLTAQQRAAGQQNTTQVTPQVQQSTQRPQTTIESPAPQSSVRLQFDPANNQIKSGDRFVVSLSMESEEIINGIDLFLNIPNTLLTLESIKPGSLIVNPMILSGMKRLDDGTVFYSLATLAKPTGKGIVAELSFIAKAPGIATVSLDSRTLVSVKDKNGVTPSLPVSGAYTIVNTAP